MTDIDGLDPDIDGPDPLPDDLRAFGLDRHFWIRKLKAELNAKETKFFQKDGIVTDQRTVIDWATRQKARQDLAMYLGDKPAERTEHEINQPLVIQIVEQPGCRELPRKGKGGDAPTE